RESQLDRADRVRFATDRVVVDISDIARADTRSLEATEGAAAFEEAVVRVRVVAVVKGVEVARAARQVEDQLIGPEALIEIRAGFCAEILLVASKARDILAPGEVVAVLRLDRVVLFIVGVGVTGQ